MKKISELRVTSLIYWQGIKVDITVVFIINSYLIKGRWGGEHYVRGPSFSCFPDSVLRNFSIWSSHLLKSASIQRVLLHGINPSWLLQWMTVLSMLSVGCITAGDMAYPSIMLRNSLLTRGIYIGQVSVLWTVTRLSTLLNTTVT